MLSGVINYTLLRNQDTVSRNVTFSNLGGVIFSSASSAITCTESPAEDHCSSRGRLRIRKSDEIKQIKTRKISSRKDSVSLVRISQGSPKDGFKII